jgi:hypothetical protein
MMTLPSSPRRAWSCAFWWALSSLLTFAFAAALALVA